MDRRPVADPFARGRGRAAGALTNFPKTALALPM
jgi:hypothetical protein